MDYDAHVLCTQRHSWLKARNVSIQKELLKLEQEFNRNKLEMEYIYVAVAKSKEKMEEWKGISHDKSRV